jgi:hypothetical protein
VEQIDREVGLEVAPDHGAAFERPVGRGKSACLYDLEDGFERDARLFGENRPLGQPSSMKGRSCCR